MCELVCAGLVLHYGIVGLHRPFVYVGVEARERKVNSVYCVLPTAWVLRTISGICLSSKVGKRHFLGPSLWMCIDGRDRVSVFQTPLVCTIGNGAWEVEVLICPRTRDRFAQRRTDLSNPFTKPISNCGGYEGWECSTYWISNECVKIVSEKTDMEDITEDKFCLTVDWKGCTLDLCVSDCI